MAKESGERDQERNLRSKFDQAYTRPSLKVLRSTRRAEQGASTRQLIVDVARDLFGERGYHDTSIEEILRRCRLARGALYHHFSGKQDLFLAVYKEVGEETGQKMRERGRRYSDPLERLRAECEAYFQACLDPAVRRIQMVDAPSVLDFETLRTAGPEHALAWLTKGIREAQKAGQLPQIPVEALARVVLGAVIEAGRFVSMSNEGAVARRDMSLALNALLTGLTEQSSKSPPSSNDGKRGSKPRTAARRG